MPKTLNSLCNAHRLHCAANAHSGHLWISDDLLLHSYHSFARHHVRWGSNVPGPLESRRRAAKRKLSLAQHGPVTTTYDPTIFLGAQAKERYWAVSQPSKEQSQWQQPWTWPFTAYLPSRKPDPPVRKVIQQYGEECLVGLAEAAFVSFLKHLDGISTCQALLDTLDELRIDLVHDHHRAQTILVRIAFRWEKKEIERFLLEPRTNPAGSGHIPHLFRQWDRYADINEHLLKDNVVLSAVRSGLLTVTDIQQVIKWSRPESNSTLPLSDFNWSKFCTELMDAIKDSRVLSILDVTHGFLQRWLGYIKRRQFELCTTELLDRLYSINVACPERRLTKVLMVCVSAVKYSSVSELHRLVSFAVRQPHDALERSILGTTMNLYYQPRLMQTDTMSPSSANQSADDLFRIALMARGRPASTDVSNGSSSGPFRDNVEVRPEREPLALEVWYAVLAGIGEKNDPAFRLSASTFQYWPSTGTRVDRHRQAKALLVFWVTMGLTLRSDRRFTPPSHSEAQGSLSAVFVMRHDGDRDNVLTKVVRGIASSGLPAQGKLFQCIKSLTGPYLNAKGSYQALQQQLDDLSACRVEKLLHQSFYRSARHNYRPLLVELAESMNSDLARFESICTGFVRDIKGATVLVQRLLTHNDKLKVALTRCADFLPVDSPAFKRTDKIGPDDLAFGGYTYSDLIGMIDRLAWECAVSERHSARKAMRMVYWLYYYLQEQSAPRTPAMRRALWHVIATRPLNPSYKMVSWVYGLVRLWEGRDVADELLHNSSSYISDVSSSEFATMPHRYAPRDVMEEWVHSTGEPSEVDDLSDSEHESFDIASTIRKVCTSAAEPRLGLAEHHPVPSPILQNTDDLLEYLGGPDQIVLDGPPILSGGIRQVFSQTLSPSMGTNPGETQLSADIKTRETHPGVSETSSQDESARAGATLEDFRPPFE